MLSAANLPSAPTELHDHVVRARVQVLAEPVADGVRPVRDDADMSRSLPPSSMSSSPKPSRRRLDV